MMSCLGCCSAISAVHLCQLCDRAYLPSHFKGWALFWGYLSAISLAVSVSRERSLLTAIAMMPRRRLLTFWNHD